MKTCLIDVLKPTEKRQFDYLRLTYANPEIHAWVDGANTLNSLEMALQYWDKNKQDLFNLFGEKLILEYPIKISSKDKDWNERFSQLYNTAFFKKMSRIYIK